MTILILISKKFKIRSTSFETRGTIRVSNESHLKNQPLGLTTDLLLLMDKVFQGYLILLTTTEQKWNHRQIWEPMFRKCCILRAALGLILSEPESLKSSSVQGLPHFKFLSTRESKTFLLLESSHLDHFQELLEKSLKTLCNFKTWLFWTSYRSRNTTVARIYISLSMKSSLKTFLNEADTLKT